MITLSHFTLLPLLAARNQRESNALVSPDLGLTSIFVALDANGVHFPDGQTLIWTDAEAISSDDVGCYALEDNAIRKIQMFSGETQRAVSLMPTPGAPTMLIAGFPMHRIKDTDPILDTQAKIKAIAPISGRVLDCNMGLGYTAIHAARTAQHVITIELDPAVVAIAEQNPWSRELFTNPRIERVIGDAFDVVEAQQDESFARVLHDPPTIQLAGDLYSADFYRELYRVLQKGGRLFHYIGDPNSTHGAKFTPGVMARLEKVGFTRVVRRPDAFGVSAHKA
ncbi:MAG: methyltransferase domain-containing protein [Chloroflexota bacterium]|nr:methyltransferase domain-containing protein [Chloroflexota bacterium]